MKKFLLHPLAIAGLGTIAVLTATLLFMPMAFEGGNAGAVALAVLMMAATWTVILFSWRRMDEAAQEAHKTAWFFGAPVGASVMFVIVMPALGMEPFPFSMSGRTDPAGYFALGLVFLAGSQVAGTLVAWAAWWLRRR